MDLAYEVLCVRSKIDAVRIADWIGSDSRRFRKLMELLLRGEYRAVQQSAWILGICYDRCPRLITPWLPALIKRMQDPEVHGGVRRNVVRILQCAEVPKPLLGTVVSLCFDYLHSYDTPIAVKAFSMTVLANAAKREPALKRELRTSLELLLRSPSGAILARARMVLKQLDKDEKRSNASSKRKRTEHSLMESYRPIP